MTKKEEQKNISKPPVIVVMGHVDHGKSTLLDYIRKTNVVDKEAGGITQHISAYEVVHKDEEGVDRKITFLDTPGHQAFSKMRERGAKVADIAILVVSAEDGVKPQTIEAYKTIMDSKTPFVVAINKIDKPGSDIERTKMALAENEIYLENYGGKVPFVPISAKSGEGVDNLLSLLNIMADLEGFTYNKNKNAEGFVIEANNDPKRGIQATLVIKDGRITKGMFVTVEDSICATRIMENFMGKTITEAEACSPIRLVGFDKMPQIGGEFFSFEKKEEAQKFIEELKTIKEKKVSNKNTEETNTDKKIIPIILKADVSGTLEAIEKEIEKIKKDNAIFKIIQSGVGPIVESDIKGISSPEDTLVIGFNVKSDRNATDLALNRKVEVSFFNIIYKMTEWLEEELEKRRPKIATTEVTGRVKILKAFSRTKERQILGGKVSEGEMTLGSTIRIMRRDFEIGRGKVVNLEKSKAKTSVVKEGDEFGMMVEGKVEIVPGDNLEAFSIVEK